MATSERPIGHAEGRSLVLIVFLGAFVALLVAHWNYLTLPPGWDSTWSVFAGGVELGRSGYDYPALLSQPGRVELGSATHAVSPVTALAGLAYLILPPQQALISLHLVSILLGAVLASLTYVLVMRSTRRASVAVLTATAALLLPMTLQQTRDYYLEIPLAVTVLVATTAILEGRNRLATLSVFVAVWIKVTGLMLLPAMLYLHRSRGGTMSTRRLLVAMGIATSPLLLRIIFTSGLESPPGNAVDSLGLLRNSILLLAVTPDVFMLLVLSAFVLARWRNTDSRLRGILGLAVIGFVAAHLGGIVLTRSTALLPRYWVAITPILLAAIASALALQHKSRYAAFVLGCLVLFSLLNMYGGLYPGQDHPHPVLAERSLAATTYTQLLSESAGWLAEQRPGPLLADGHMYFRLKYPEMGFIETGPRAEVLALDFPPGLNRFDTVLESYGAGDGVTSNLRAEVEAARERGLIRCEDALTVGDQTSLLIVAGPIGSPCRLATVAP